MNSIEDFAAELLRGHGADLKAGARKIIEGDFHAGEWEAAAISAIEVAANVTPQELAELAAFAADFDPIDAPWSPRSLLPSGGAPAPPNSAT